MRHHIAIALDRRFDWNWVLGILAIVCTLAGQATAQNDLEKALEEIEVLGSLMDEAPFDIITLKPEATGRSVKVAPIDFPDRRVPTDKKDADKLQVTILLFADRRYEVAWKDIGKIWLYEQMILARAKKLVDDKNFGEAFEHLNFLFVNYPRTPGLQVMRQDFLFRSAEEMARQKRLAHTLAVLEELQKTFPNYQRENVRSYITSISGQLVQSYFDKKDLATARTMINRLAKEYKDDPLPVGVSTKISATSPRWQGPCRLRFCARAMRFFRSPRRAQFERSGSTPEMGSEC